jgi:hypothetical protein
VETCRRIPWVYNISSEELLETYENVVVEDFEDLSDPKSGLVEGAQQLVIVGILDW